MKKKRKLFIYLSIFLLLFILLDFSPIIYYKVAYPVQHATFYSYDKTSPKCLLKAIESLKDENISTTKISEIKDHYQHIAFFDKTSKNYYHTWILSDTLESKDFTQIILSYVSNTLNFKDGRQINADFDFITNYFLKRSFEKNILEKLGSDDNKLVLTYIF